MPENPKLPKISILVDYAHEPESMRQLLTTLKDWRDKGIFDYVIHIVSCDGAGRDNWKKPIMGKLSYDFADFSVVTLDNYNEKDNPQEILSMLTRDFDPNREEKKYLVTQSRKKAFTEALEQAGKVYHETGRKINNIIVVSTGVGCEYGLTQPGGTIEWDEKKIWQEEYDLFVEKMMN
jgi:UDP-N-acetylmuramyl tripeptide synthase